MVIPFCACQWECSHCLRNFLIHLLFCCKLLVMIRAGCKVDSGYASELQQKKHFSIAILYFLDLSHPQASENGFYFSIWWSLSVNNVFKSKYGRLKQEYSIIQSGLISSVFIYFLVIFISSLNNQLVTVSWNFTKNWTPSQIFCNCF